MALRKAQPFTFRAKGLSDALDGTNTFPGAMASLSNLILAPSDENLFVCRPAEQLLTNFPSFTTPTNITAFSIIGTRVYGMISSGRFPGYDEPFCYDLSTSAFITISGVTSSNVPVSPSAAGDWTPPKVESITQSKTIVTHPGFSGSGSQFFGVIDTSSYSLTSLRGNLTNTSTTIRSISGDGTSSPILDGVQPGQVITGTGIPANTTVVSVTNGTFSLSTTGSTHTSTTLDTLGSTTGVEIGMYVSGTGIVAGTYVTAINSSTSVTLSVAAVASASGVAINFSGGGLITLSAAATATNTAVSLSISGGTYAAPRWAAVNTNSNPLSAVPASVAQFNGRAYFAVNNSLVFSDSLNPTQVTSATQALILDGAAPITAVSGVPLDSPITGGIVQSIMAFRGAGPFYQISGDSATQNLTQNLVNGSVGTLAPNSITPTPLGLAFIAPDGLRILGLNANVTDPIGDYGKGVCVPFLNALYPSRMSAAYNQNTLRITVQNGALATQPYQEYWYSLDQEMWTGPHSSAANLIKPYYGNAGGFITALHAMPAFLMTSTAIPTSSASYLAMGTQALTWVWQTTLLPDSQMGSMNAIIESTIMLALGYTQQIYVEVMDEDGNSLDVLTITGQAPAVALAGFTTGGRGNFTANPSTSAADWGSFNWGAAKWGSLSSVLKQYLLPWNQPLVARQMSLRITGTSTNSVALGNLYFKYQSLGYQLGGFTQ